MSCQLTQEQIDRAIAFHGHWCPGLAGGIRAAEWVLAELGSRSEDEELVAVVETDFCGVDAIQYLTGCTFGKGNLIYRDYGKLAFSFYRRSDDKAVRLVLNRLGSDADRETLAALYRRQAEGLTPEEEALRQSLRERMAAETMNAAFNDLFDIQALDDPPPRKARILASRVCDGCGENVMETRTRSLHGRCYCLPCFDRRKHAAPGRKDA
jgi:formylmethanofuran dehydrogenase subunit E